MIAACLVFVGADTPAPAVPDFAKRLPEFKSGEPVFAFNGKDLDGWYTFLHDEKYEDPNKVFSVQDGMLRISGQGFGGITTKQTFKDYHLVTEWKWGEKTWDVPNPKKEGAFFRRATAARDAGILVHGVGEDGAYGGHWLESIEVQLIEGGVGDFIIVAGKAAPSLTVEARVDGKQIYFEPGGQAGREAQRPHQLVGPRSQLDRHAGLSRPSRRRKPPRGVEPPRSRVRRRPHHHDPQRLRRQRRHQVQPHRRKDPTPDGRLRKSSSAKWKSARW